ncbi:hypothetical protein [Streptomyces meridianus]|uniref:Integral membrane protein n=1 Tax=Streptomyces meridianus TaxID=2938945 RepID=A0ABT0X9X0_9ACTN|nr:hypothetical protein [Streptomyces meridianus]MCM2578507.1 hypothetical protein [Streptomyces meridianus]
MAQAVRHQKNRFAGLNALMNSDGKAHPVENGFALGTLLLGVVAFVTSNFYSLHILASWTGLVGILVGARSQMISATTGERFVSIIGLGAAAVGFFLGMARGGLFGGVLG